MLSISAVVQILPHRMMLFPVFSFLVGALRTSYIPHCLFFRVGNVYVTSWCKSLVRNVSLHGQGKKNRRNVERRASKGRKLRYQVMEKLVHFMAPAERSEPPTMAAQLFSNLFGHSGPVKA